MKAIILAGGKGSRLKPLTDTIPKALVSINDKTLIERSLESLPENIDTVIITTNYLGEKIEEKIGNSYNGKKVIYAPQPKEISGTWSAVYGAQAYIDTDELFLVYNCDDLFTKAELTLLTQQKTPCMGVTKRTMPAKYHGIQISEEGYIKSFQRHPHENREEIIEDIFANGVFLLNKEIFFFPPVSLIDGEYGLPQTLLAQKNVYPLKAFMINNWHPCNSFEDLERVQSIKQVQRALPIQAWKTVTINENNEPLVEIKKHSAIIFGLNLDKWKYTPSFSVRKTVTEMLERAADLAKQKGYKIILIEGYRTLAHQELSYTNALKEMREKNPDLSDEEIEIQVRAAIAKPTPLANHNCGGALDVALATQDDKILDFGSPYPHTVFSIETRRKFPMFSSYITENQKNNRRILREIMEEVGFVWYPAEWWHYCYGDRMWAVYTERTECMYGSMDNK